MKPSARQQELEKLYNARRGRGHAPQISISDDDHHVTEAIGSSYYDEPTMPAANGNARPYSFVNSPSETYEQTTPRNSKRNGSLFDMKNSSQQRVPLAQTGANEKVPTPTESINTSPKHIQRMSSLGAENGHGKINGNGNGNGNGNSTTPPTSPPPLTRQPSSEAAMQSFPLNDIDYESSPAAVAQELSNLQAIRRMSMNVDKADPDLPSFGGVVPSVAPDGSEDEDDPSRLFWVPARLHPELAPKEFKTFLEDRVDTIRRRSGDSDSLSVDGLERSGSGSSSLRRKKSMLSHQVDPKGSYEDGAERLERKRSRHMPVEGQTQLELSELESLVKDPAQLIRRMSLDAARRSQDSGVEVPASEDMPILAPVGQSLKRSTRTTYRRGSLRKGERVPFSKRAQHRQPNDPESDDNTSAAAAQSFTPEPADEPVLGLTRVQTEPIPPPTRNTPETFPRRTDASPKLQHQYSGAQTTDDIESRQSLDTQASQGSSRDSREEEAPPPPRPQHRQFQSRLASGGRTTAQLPGYNNQNPLPKVVETLPDGTKVPVAATLIQHVPERKSSHELPRPFQRGGAHMRPVPGRDHQRSSTLDDISLNPSPLPGSGNTRTDALTMVPTFDDRKVDKKDGTRKSSWKWILGNDDDEKKAKDEKLISSDSVGAKSSKNSKLSKVPADKARLDVLQNSIDGNIPPRGRESIVLSREDVRLDDERRKESKKASEPKKDKEKDSGLLSAIFGGKKKGSDTDLKERKRKSDRNISPDPTPRILKPDIDYNWTRFSILEERAIYRMAHIKLANPRRALYSQVLLSNFMYSYLAKVQMMHPQVQIPPAHQKSQQRGQKQQQQQQQEQQHQQQQQQAEYSQYQQWHKQQDRDSSTPNNADSNKRTSLDIATGGAQQPQHQQRSSYDYDEDSSTSYDTRSSEEYDYDHSYQSQAAPQRANGGGQARGGYSVAGTHDYLGYPKNQQPFDSQNGLWEDDDKPEEMW